MNVFELIFITAVLWLICWVSIVISEATGAWVGLVLLLVVGGLVSVIGLVNRWRRRGERDDGAAGEG